MSTRSFAARAWGAVRLDTPTYEEIEADPRATWQAFVVVLVSALAAGVGSLGNSGVDGILWSGLAALLGWWIWAWVAYKIGTQLLPGRETQADHGELLRTIGFSSAPGVLRVFALFPAVAGWVYSLATLWMLVSMVVAVRQALDYPENFHGTLRAIAVCAIGFPVYMVCLVVPLLMLGPWPV